MKEKELNRHSFYQVQIPQTIIYQYTMQSRNISIWTIAFLLLTIQSSNQSSCPMLCTCTSGECSYCFDSFKNDAGSGDNDACGCPQGFYSQNSICEFCPDTCEACDDASTCTACKVGHYLVEGQCIRKKYQNQVTWVTYPGQTDFYVADDGSYSSYGFTATSDGASLDIQWLSCLGYSNTKVLHVGGQSNSVSLDRLYKGLPYHQWAHISIQYIVIDEWNNNDVVISVGNQETTLSYDNSMRHADICGDGQADGLGHVDLYTEHSQSTLQLTVTLEAGTQLGIKSVSMDVGTCPRNCLTCSSPTACLSCAAPFTLVDGECTCDSTNNHQTFYGCIQHCQDGYVYNEGSHKCFLCELYIPSCFKCSITTACQECKQHHYLLNDQYGSRCLGECPWGYFEEEVNDVYVCTECAEGCSSCSHGLCHSCSADYYLHKGVCYSGNCPEDTSQVDGICQDDVDSSCTTVQNCQDCTSSQCNVCDNGFWLHNGTCSQNCPSTTYPASNKQCKPCSDNCLQCVDDETCSVCEYTHILADGECLSQYSTSCGSEQYYDLRVRSCVDCPEHCTECYRELCKSCESGYLLDNGDCVVECSAEKTPSVQVCEWKDSLCMVYNSYIPEDCHQCRELESGIFYDMENYCVLVCDNGYTFGSNNICDVECGDNCQQCYQAECMKCEAGYFLDSAGSCTSDCGSGFTTNSLQCIPCASGCTECDITGACTEWSETLTTSCTDSNCVQCQESSPAICVKCDTDYYLSSDVCVDVCEDGTFSDTLSGQCQKCSPTCLTCDSYGQCSSCKEGFYMDDENACVQICYMSTYADPQTHQCQACAQNCKNCYGPQPSQCLECYFGYKLDHSQCVLDCPVNRYEDDDGHCDWCHEACVSCYGPEDFQCKECNGGYYVYRGQCYNECPTATYIFNPTIRECKDCAWGCSVCESPSVCTTCLLGFYLHNGVCKNLCPMGTYFSLDSNQCVACSTANCSACVSDVCTRCSDDNHLYNGNCVQNCPAGTYMLDYYYGSDCRACPSQCQTCVKYYQCQSCKTGYNLENGQCVTYCPMSQYFNSSNDQCQNCPDNCQMCSMHGQCKKCENKFYIDVSGECVESCSVGTFADISGYCASCSPFCSACTSYQSCSSCQNGYVLSNGKCHNENPPSSCVDHCLSCYSAQYCSQCDDGYLLQMEEWVCVEVCPDGTYTFGATCLKCQSPCTKCTATGCAECPSDFIFFNGQCLQSCPNGYYLDNNQCTKCPESCRTCDGNGVCIDCIGNYILTDNNQCISECGANEYYSASGNTCLPCGENCDTCVSSLQCSVCSMGNYLSNGQCSSTCPEGTYIDSTKCSRCPFGCKQCTSADTCQSCSNGFALNMTVCQPSCASGYFINDENQCEECSVECLTCINNANECQKCRDTYFLLGIKCVKDCPDGTYDSAQHRACYPCSDSCEDCISAAQCISCQEGTTLFGGQCMQFCPEGYYKSNGYCKQCNSPCAECSDGSIYSCEKCVSGFYLYNDRCVSVCPDGYFPQQSTYSCQQCSEDCAKCVDYFTCQECSAGTLTNGFCIDPQPTCSTNCEVCDSTECKSCYDGFYLQNGQCVEECDEAYFKGRLTGKCRPCSSGCISCRNKIRCWECQEGKFLFLGVCLDECPSFTYEHEGKCKITPCLHRNAGACTECVSPYKVQDGVCVTQCSTGYYETALQCLPCGDNCVSCYNNEYCSECESGYYRDMNKCVDECGVGKFPNDEDKCQSCSNYCLTCSAIDVCTRCETGYFLINNACMSICASGTYMDISERKCVDCPHHCDVCSATECYECETNYYQYKGSCVDECPLSYYTEDQQCKQCPPTCAECSSQLTCSECNEGYQLYQGKCQIDCPATTYLKEQQCVQCENNCDTCTSADSCTSCEQNYYLFKHTCVASCPVGYYHLNTSNICKQCDAECKECSGAADECTSCYDGYALQNNYCHRECESGKYMDAVSNSCEECASMCQQCYGGHADQCTSCISTHYLLEDRCVEQCPDGYFKLLQVCAPCDEKCETCEDTEDSCLTCPSNRYLHEGECLTYCPDAYYPTNGSCSACDSSCASCVGGSAHECTACADGHWVMEGTCVNSCPDSYYKLSQSCVACPANCAKCTSAGNCSECVTNANLYNQQCYIDCPVSTFQSGNVCLECQQAHCIQCTDKNTCTICQNAFILNGSCVQSCPQSYVQVDDRCMMYQNNTECDKYIVNDECVQYCPGGFYSNGTDCVMCTSPCLLCTDSGCQKCAGSLILFEGTCITNCPTGYVTVNQACGPCADNCADCYQTPTQCKACDSGYVLFAMQCVQVCPVGYYSSNNVCVACSDKCADCDNALECTVCKNTNLDTPNCVEDVCASNQFEGSDGSCNDCHANCKSCSGPTANQCLSCQSSDVLVSGQCRSACPDSYYADNGECFSCGANCKRCDASACTECITSYILHEGECVGSCSQLSTNQRGYLEQNETCVLCPQNCQSCSDSSTCLICRNSYMVLNGTCYDECPSKHYPFSLSCYQCGSNCVKCSQTECLQCDEDTYLRDGYCTDTCLIGEYGDAGACHDCTKNCQVCDVNGCTQCKSPFSLHNGQCTSCIEGYVYDTDAAVCKGCQQRCSTCSLLSNNCTACQAGYYLLDGACISDCPVGYFQSSGECSQCEDNCDECTSASDCSQCMDGYVLSANNSCLQGCDDYFYEVNGECVSCPTDCKQCTADKCTQCRNEFILHDEICIDECPAGSFPDSTGCTDCMRGCIKCTNSSDCQQCRSDFSLVDNDCSETTNCQYGQYEDSNGDCQDICDAKQFYNEHGTCTTCINLCDECQNGDECISCRNDSFVYESVCYAECPNKTYPVGSNCQECGNNCIQCQSSTKCTQCADEYFIYNERCRENCPNAHYSNGTHCVACSDNCLMCEDNTTCLQCDSQTGLYEGECMKNCPTTTYMSDSICEECQSPCKDCLDQDRCKTCIEGFKLNGETCVSECDDGKYLKNSSCEDCSVSACKHCSETECFQCMNEKYVFTNTTTNKQSCVRNCPTEFFEEGDDCQACPSYCAECSSETQCQQCVADYYLLENECIDECPNTTYHKEGKCENCVDNCVTCVDSISCDTCEENFFLYHNSSTKSSCVSECPSTYYEQNGVCVRCGDFCHACMDADYCEECISQTYELLNNVCIHENCVNCTTCVNDICKQCVDGLFLYNSKCHEICPDGLYGNSTTGTCKQCMEFCQICSDSTSCDKCVKNYDWLEHECVPEQFIQFGFLSNMSGFTSNITATTATVYLATSVGPIAFGEMTTTYFNIQFTQFIFFHDSASGGNKEMAAFLQSLQVMSLTMSGDDSGNTTRRRMLEDIATSPSYFLQVNVPIFILMGTFLLVYFLIYIFQRNIDSCCVSCPKLHFIVNEICIYLKARFKWIYFDFVAWISYMPFLYFAVVQLANFSFEDALTGFSSILSIIIIIVYPLYPIRIAYLIKKYYRQLAAVNKDKMIQMSMEPYMYKVKRPEDELDEGQTLTYCTFENWRLMYYPLKYFRKFLFALVVGVAADPITAVSTLLALNIIFIVYMFVFRPRLMPYMVFDFIIEFVLLFFEIFMLVYLVIDGSKIDAMSIITHAVGFITANLSIILAIVLNLYAYFKIFMCIYELVQHVKEKLEEKEKKEKMGSSDGDSSEVQSNSLHLDKDLMGLGGRKFDDDEFTDQFGDHRKGLMDDKEIFENTKNNSNLLLDDQIPKLKGKKKKRNKTNFGKEFENNEYQVDDDGLTDQDENDPNFMKDKELFDGGNKFGETGEDIPNLKSVKKKKGKKHQHYNFGKEFENQKKVVDDDEFTDEDPDYNSAIMKDKEIYANKIKESVDMDDIPNLKSSKRKKTKKHEHYNFGKDIEQANKEEVDDQCFTDEDPQIYENPQFLKDKEFFGDPNKKYEIGEDIPELKGSDVAPKKGKHKKEIDESHVFSEQGFLPEDGKMKEVDGKKYKRGKIESNQKGNIQEGKIKQIEKNKYKRNKGNKEEKGPQQLNTNERKKAQKKTPVKEENFNENKKNQDNIKDLETLQRKKKSQQKAAIQDNIKELRMKQEKKNSKTTLNFDEFSEDKKPLQKEDKIKDINLKQKDKKRGNLFDEDTGEGKIVQVQGKDNKFKRVNKNKNQNKGEQIEDVNTFQRKQNFREKQKKSNQDNYDNFLEEGKTKQIDRKKKNKKDRQFFNDDGELYEISPQKHKRIEKKKCIDDDFGEDYQKKKKVDQKQQKKDGNLKIQEEQVEDYDEIKRKNKDALFSPVKKGGKLSQMQNDDDFEGSDYDGRPKSKIQVTQERGKGHLGIDESQSDHEDTLSVRKRRNSAIQRMRKKGNLSVDEDSDSSVDDSQISRIGKPKKAKRKREKSGILQVNKRQQNQDELDEIHL